MSADDIFFTGFPGFLGRELLPRVLSRTAEGGKALCLVQPRYRADADRALAAIEGEHPDLAGRTEIIEGDITAPDLGLGDALERIAKGVAEIFHLAAVYDLSVGRDFAMRVNVDGTRHILDFARRCPNLRRHQYVSTCYVSGAWPGAFRESDLERGQRFNNFYEETKYLAEVLVQRAMAEGMPTTIYRPGIVVGDSTTGETQKYDGPYFLLQWVMRQPKALTLMPVVADPEKVRLNVVPRDFVVDAIAYLSAQENSLGQVYQLADDDAPTIEEIYLAIEDATDRTLTRVRLPVDAACWMLEHVTPARNLIRIPPSAVPYFAGVTHHLADNTKRDLEGSGIRCPRLPEYLDALVRFVEAHPEVGSSAMV